MFMENKKEVCKDILELDSKLKNMILTGNAKRDFEVWLNYDLFNFNNRLDEVMQFAKIIEWFDTVNINICVCRNYYTDNICFETWDDKYFAEDDLIETKLEATKMAIKKAN